MNRSHACLPAQHHLTLLLFLTLIITVAITDSHAQFVQAGGKIVPVDITGTPHLGWSVAISGDGRTAVAGGASDANGAGGAWTFVRQGDVWIPQGEKLIGTGNDGNASQGSAVAISADGNTIAISGESDAEAYGAVWVFVRSGNTWVQQGPKLVGTGATWKSYQGSALALSNDGSTLLVGAQFDSNGIGAAYVYVRSGNSWAQQGPKLVGSGDIEKPYQGSSVCLSGDGNMAAVGAASDNWDSGAVWIYRRTGGVWAQEGNKLTAPVGSGTESFGAGVALSDDGTRLLVGAYSDNGLTGCAWVYDRQGDAWTLAGPKFVPSDISYHATFGRRVSLSADGNTAVIGGNGDESMRGACWVYKRIDGTWQQYGTKVFGSEGSWDAQQGVAAIADDATAIVTAGYNDDGGIGAVWMFVDRSVDVSVTDPRSQQFPGRGGLVRLYDGSRSLVASGSTDDSGRVSFYAVAPGPDHVCTVHWPAADTTTSFDTLSWGSLDAITLVSGRTTVIPFERNAPRIDTLDVIDPATGKSVRGSSLYAGFPLRLELRVRHGHAQHPAQVRGLVHMSIDTSGTAVVHLTTDSAVVQPDSVCVLHALYTPSSAGTFSAVIGAMTGADGAAEPTDVLDLRAQPLFTASILPLPGAVVLTDPPGGAGERPVMLMLRWHTAARAARYHVQVTADAAGWNALVMNDTSRVDTSATIAGLQYAQTYRWRVRAINITGPGAWSEERSFQTTAIDPTRLPVLIAPVNGVTAGDSAVVLRWTSTTGALSYRVQVSLDSLFVVAGAVKEFSTADTSVIARTLAFETSYWWRVWARYDSVTVAGPTGAWHFVTGLPRPGAILLVRPEHLYGTLDTTTFIWHRSAPSVTRYWFEQGLDSLFAVVTVDSMLTDTTKFMHVWGQPKGWLGRCYWRVRAWNASGWGAFSEVRKVIQLIDAAVKERPEGVPDTWALEQNYPNPFNPQTVIRYGLPVRALVVLTVYNTLGQQVAELQNGEREAGYHEALFDARGLPSGMYFYRLETPGYRATKKLIVVR